MLYVRMYRRCFTDGSLATGPSSPFAYPRTSSHRAVTEARAPRSRARASAPVSPSRVRRISLAASIRGAKPPPFKRLRWL